MRAATGKLAFATALLSSFFFSPWTCQAQTAGTGSVTLSGTLQSKQQTTPATSGTGWVSFSAPGSLQTYTFDPCGEAGHGSCPQTVVNGGSIAFTVAGQQFTITYTGVASQDATAMASAINQNSSYVTATASGSTTNLTAKTTGTASNYAMSCCTYNWNTGSNNGTPFFSGPNDTASTSGSSLTGGANSSTTTIYDSGSCTITVNSHGDSTSWSGSGTTSSSIASALSSSINGDGNASVSASASGSIVNLTAKTTGSGTDYSLSSSCSYDTSNFSSPSFSSSNSGATLTGGSNPSPNIASISPTSGAVGASVTITGTNFGSSQGTSTVTFNGTAATPTSWSATSIVVPVPSAASTGNVVVTVGGQASNGVNFTVVPSITSVSPSSGSGGTSVTISGTMFGTTQGTSTVTFNGTAATPTSWSATSIVVLVPSAATTGNVVVTVSGQASNGVGFTVVPSITSVSPSSGGVGASVTIAGTTFGGTQGTSTVTFNGTAASPTSWSATSIVVPVPSAATTGNVVVTVGGQASNGASFTVVPNITSLSPNSGAVGTSVTITGTSFGATQGTSTVTFNGTVAALTVSATAGTGSVSFSAPGSIQTYTFNPCAPTQSCPQTVSNAGSITLTLAGQQFTISDTGVASQDATAMANAINQNSSYVTATASGSSTNLTAKTTGTGSNYAMSCCTYAWNTGSFNGTPFFSGPNDTASASGSSLTGGGNSSWSATSIGVTVPSAATTGNVVVTVGGQASNGVSFTVAPHITSVSPSSGSGGTSVTISGTTFGTTQGSSTVTFNGTAATPTSWSTTSIVVPVPSGATTGNVVVTVGGQASNGVSFTVVPSITSVSPNSGAAGASVTIAGTTFGPTQGTSTVTFNGTAATPTSWSATSIVVPVPSGATTGNVIVTVGGKASNGVSFTVVPTPSVTSLSPSSAAVGASVTISGTNFGSSQGSSTVTFNGTAATITSWSSTTIVTVVPSAATTGNLVVTVSGVSSSGTAFTVLPAPSITSLSPSSAAVGYSVTINGANFGSSQGGGSVSFNGTAATITSWNATSIVTAVPTGASSGNVVVKASGVSSNGLPFTVLPTPNITSLSSNSGGVGTLLTLTGTNFGTTQGSSSISFNGTLGTATGWSSTTLVVAVPSGATTGNVVVTVSGVASNGIAFAVNQAPSITSLSSTRGAVGASITITGNNFGATQSTSTVTFNGTTATPNSWGATSITVPVPNGATSGMVVVTAAGQVSNGAPFTVVLGPSIGSLSLTSGAVGASVTVTGSKFGASQGTGTVTFNGVAAVPWSWSDTSIITSVPSGATTGSVVVNASGIASNGVAFSVLPAPSIASVSPSSTSGSSVTITGSNFGASQGSGSVTIGGKTAGASSWSATSITVSIPYPIKGTVSVAVSAAGVSSNSVPLTIIPRVAVTSFFPSAGGVGTVVSVMGFNFGATQGTSTVAFGSVVATPTSWSDNLITVPVPSNVASGNNIIYVTVAGSTNYLFCSLNPCYFAVPSSAPSSSISPTGGPAGTVVTFTGSGFGTTPGKILFDTVSRISWPVSSWSDTQIVATEPSGLPSGSDCLFIQYSNGANGGCYSFYVGNLPTISSISPTSGPAGSTVTVTGSHFGSSQGSSGISFGGVAAAPTTWSDGQIVATVPLALPNGAASVVVNLSPSAYPYGPSAQYSSFQVMGGPQVNSVSPTSGPCGTSLTIAGSGFGASAGSVNFNGGNASASSWSSTSIVVAVPAFAVPGNLHITSSAGAPSNNVAFAAFPCQGTGFLPTYGPVGTPVALSGSGFGASQGSNSSVTIGGVQATPTSWTDTQIIAPVPPGAPTGAASVVLTVNGQNAFTSSQSSPFTVTPQINSASPQSGAVATVVTLTGTNFGASQGSSILQFGSVVASPTSWGDTQIIAPVPSGVYGTVNITLTVSIGGQNFVTQYKGFLVDNGHVPQITGVTPKSGPPGSIITILGKNFGASQGNGTVAFNDGQLTATVRNWSDTQITTVVPSGAITGAIFVTIDGDTVLPVQNPLFEATSPLTQSCGSINCWNTGPIPGWTGTGGSWQPNANYALPLSDGGLTVAYSNGGSISQTLNGILLLPNSTYKLSVAVGHRLDGYVTTYSIALNAGSTVLNSLSGSNSAITAGTFADQFLTYSTGPTAPAGNLSIVLTSGGSQIDFDKVRLTVGSQAVPTTAAWYFPVVQYTNSGPTVSAISPTEGPIGTVVTIAGINFGSAQGRSTIQFGPVQVTPASWSDTQIVATVPSGTPSGSVAIVVAIDGASAQYAVFQVTGGPQITSVVPLSGAPGTPITITGINFGSTQGTSTIQFGSAQTTPTSWSNNQIVALVPGGTPAGLTSVTVIVNGQSSTYGGFQIGSGTAPQITALSQQSGVAGTSLSVMGNSFGTSVGSSSIAIGGLLVTPTSWSDSQINVTVPSSVAAGAQVVSVTVNEITAQYSSFYVFPKITGVSPTGPLTPGTTMQIAGTLTGFDATLGSTVQFGSTYVTPVSWNAAQVSVVAPTGVDYASSTIITVTISGLSASYGIGALSIVPEMSSFSESPAQVITISGTNLGTSGTVTFKSTGGSSSSVNGTPTSWSDTQIVVPVPSGAPAGIWFIQVTRGIDGLLAYGQPDPNNGGQLNGVYSLSPPGASPGASITILGTGFGASQGSSTITFCGVAATASSWSNTQVVVAVPTGLSPSSCYVYPNYQYYLKLQINGTTYTAPFIPAPAAPTNLAAVAVGSAALLSWSGSAGSVTVFRNGSPISVISCSTYINGICGGIPNQYFDSPLAASTSYTYQVQNINYGVASPLSNAATVTTGGVVTTPIIFSTSPVGAPHGSSVIITGENLGSTSGTVFFGTTAALVQLWNPTSVVVQIPASISPGIVPVQIYTASGPSNVVPFTVTVPGCPVN